MTMCRLVGGCSALKAETVCFPELLVCTHKSAAAAQPAKVRQSCSATDYYYPQICTLSRPFQTTSSSSPPCEPQVSQRYAVPMLTHHTMNSYRELCIVNLGTRCRRMVSFMLWPFYPRGRSPWYPLGKMLVCTQRTLWRREELLSFPGIELRS
jgi:hypothetical protein